MTQDQYTKEIQAIEKQTKELKWQVSLRYAKANQKYKIGDILRSNSHIIEVDKIIYGYSFDGKFPEAHYFGYVLTAKLERYKNNDRHQSAQSSITEELFRKIKK